jgi:tRNA-Thr(GGU) m(6)t(6)A37 methyltransferase TsaA
LIKSITAGKFTDVFLFYFTLAMNVKIMVQVLISILMAGGMLSLPGQALLSLHQNHPKPENMTIAYHPIGRFHSRLTPQTGAPRQGALQPENKATIEIEREFTGALQDLQKYEYIIVLYHMHLSRDWQSEVRPPGSKRSMGLFATRSPNRPNPIGFGVIKLDHIKGNVLHVSGADAFDGTPVLDIKPWIPGIDCPSGNASPDIEDDLGLGNEAQHR